MLRCSATIAGIDLDSWAAGLLAVVVVAVAAVIAAAESVVVRLQQADSWSWWSLSVG